MCVYQVYIYPYMSKSCLRERDREGYDIILKIDIYNSTFFNHSPSSGDLKSVKVFQKEKKTHTLHHTRMLYIYIYIHHCFND